MHVILWVLQILLGAYFIFTGAIHFVLPPGLPQPMSWMYDLPGGLHAIAGVAEILGGLGLILPGLTRVRTELTVLAGLGLVLVMVGAAAWHLTRGEVPNVVMNAVVAAVAGFVAYGRWRIAPLPARSEPAA